MKLRRSIIWGRGDDIEDAKEKLARKGGDGFCIDLEDGVPFVRKDEARKKTVEMIRTLDFRGRECVVRVNPVDTDDFLKDIQEVIAVAQPNSIRVPKCETVRDMIKVDTLLEEIEKRNNLAPNSIEVIAMIESPLGIRNAYDIATSCERITALNLGMEDLTREMGVKRRYEGNELDLIYARQKFVLDAKAAGVHAIDSCALIWEGGQETFEKQSREAKQAGFTGRSCRDNEEALIANVVFSPAPEDVEWSKKAIEVYERSIEENIPEAIYEGQKICYAAYEKALNLINLSNMIETQT